MKLTNSLQWLRQPEAQWVRADALWPSGLATPAGGRGFDPRKAQRSVFTSDVCQLCV